MNLVLYPDARLTTMCQPVQGVIDHDTVSQMAALAVSRGGYAVAAPQVGLPSRFFVFSAQAAESLKVPQVWINPEIIGMSGERVVTPEGCLSIPDVGAIRSYRPTYPEFHVERWKEIRVSLIDQTGVEHLLPASGLLARIIQHEIDHLDGTLITDRVLGDEKDRADRFLRILAKRRAKK